MSLAQLSVNLQSPTPQRPRPARGPALNNARPHTGPEVGSARELLRPSIHPSHVARSLGDCMDLHSRTWGQTRRSGSDRTALVCARLRHQRSQQHQFLAGSVASFDIILVPERICLAGDGVPRALSFVSCARLRPPRRGRGRPRDCRQGAGATDHLLDADFEIPPLPAAGILPEKGKHDSAAAGERFRRQVGVIEIPSAVFGIAVVGRLPVVNTPMNQSRIHCEQTQFLPAGERARLVVIAPVEVLRGCFSS
jgi:hypothetical protein